MADTKLTDLTSNTAPLGSDIILMTDDPGGSPLSQKVTLDILDTYRTLPASLVTETTASGTVTLTDASTPIQAINCNGTAYDVVLPGTSSTTNHAFLIKNTWPAGSAVKALTVKSGTNIVATLRNHESDIFYSTGTAWSRMRPNKTQYVQIGVFQPTVDVATGDGKAYFMVPRELDTMNLVEVVGDSITAGTTGTMTVQIRNVTQSKDMLSTLLTWDSAETSTRTAATACVIQGTADDVYEGNIIAVDVDSKHTTAAKGMYITLGFALP